MPASLIAMAIACALLVTTGPFLERECNLPFLYSRITTAAFLGFLPLRTVCPTCLI